jgi:predicted ferric reductase
VIPTRYRPELSVAFTLALNACVWTWALWHFHSLLPTIEIPWWNVAGEFLSTSALIIASTNLMLSTRARPFEDAFGGLDKMYTSHRFNGLTVGCIIVGHFLVIPKHTPFGPSGWFGFTAITLILLSVILAIAPRSPWRRLVPLRYQDWKLAHRTMGLLVATVVVHSLLAHPFNAALPAVRWWIYTFAALGLCAYAYRETIGRPIAQRHRYRVTRPRQLSPDVYEIPLEPTRSAISHRAGQFAFVRFEKGPTHEQHPFTISMAPAAGRLRFSIKASGDFTLALQAHLAEGSLARIEGPYGRFDYTKAGPRQLWVAGGIGITPFLAFLQTLDGSHDVNLVWSVHDRIEAVHADEVGRAAETTPGLTVTIHESAASGRLHMADLGIDHPAGLDVFICGPVPMRKAYVDELTSLGVPVSRIRYEEFSLR